MVRVNSQICGWCDRLFRTDIVKVFSLTALSTLIKMLTGFVSIKIVAVIIGPDGIALMGQLSNFSTIMMAVAVLGINNGITKYVAEYKQDQHKLKQLLSTALKITMWGTLLSGLFMIIACNWLSRLILLSEEWSYVFIIFGLTIILYSMNQFFLSIINGEKKFKKFVRISITNSAAGLVFTLLLVYFWKLSGALIGMVTFHSIMFIVTLWYIRHEEWFSWEYFKEKINKPIAIRYFNYSIMTLTTAAVVPVSQLILRGYVIHNISVIEAGWWEAMNRLSGAYLMVITSSFGVYYLPRLSELKQRSELHNEIFKAYKVIIPMLFVGFLAIYFFRTFIINILFSHSFLPMENLFIWQLIGDVFRVSSWLLAYLMIAKAKTKIFVITEIFFSALTVVLSFLFINYTGIVGLTQASMVVYIIYTLTMVVYFRKIVFLKPLYLG